MCRTGVGKTLGVGTSFPASTSGARGLVRPSHTTTGDRPPGTSTVRRHTPPAEVGRFRVPRPRPSVGDLVGVCEDPGLRTSSFPERVPVDRSPLSRGSGLVLEIPRRRRLRLGSRGLGDRVLARRTRRGVGTSGTLGSGGGRLPRAEGVAAHGRRGRGREGRPSPRIPWGRGRV